MYSSYFAVPGRGGASAGMPPIAAGMASLTPAAIFSLMGAATGQAAAREGNGDDRDNMARTGRHRQKVTASLFKDDGFRARPPGIVKGASLLTGPFYLYNRTNSGQSGGVRR